MSLFKTYIRLSTSLALVFLASCGGEEPNPCAEEAPVTAAFKIEETFQLPNLLPESWEFYDTDTVNTNYVMFTAIEDSAVYEWQLGAETLTEQSFTRHSFPRGENIEVSLKVTKTPNLGCFPDDDGEDEVSRSFYVTEKFICGSLVTGTYVGFNMDEEDNARTVSIDVCYDLPGDPLDRNSLRIINLVEGCDTNGFGIWFSRYRQLNFGANGTIDCLDPTGTVKIFGAKNDSILINYNIKRGQDIFDDRISKMFKGIRKN